MVLDNWWRYELALRFLKVDQHRAVKIVLGPRVEQSAEGCLEIAQRIVGKYTTATIADGESITLSLLGVSVTAEYECVNIPGESRTDIWIDGVLNRRERCPNRRERCEMKYMMRYMVYDRVRAHAWTVSAAEWERERMAKCGKHGRVYKQYVTSVTKTGPTKVLKEFLVFDARAGQQRCLSSREVLIGLRLERQRTATTEEK